MANPKRTRYNSGHRQDKEMSRNLDTLAEMEEFHNTVLPKLRRMVTEGKAAAEMYTEFQSLIAARVISAALTTEDAKVMLAAVSEIFNRGLGKPKETIDITSRYEKLSDAELDALLKSEEEALEEMAGDVH